MKVNCTKHVNHNGFPMPILMVPIQQTDGILQYYCPKCDCYSYTRDTKTFYDRKEDVPTS
jgi:hypothetical protein